jgi:hypothetical protein
MHISGECRSGTGGILSYNTNISLTWGLKRGYPFSWGEGAQEAKKESKASVEGNHRVP